MPQNKIGVLFRGPAVDALSMSQVGHELWEDGDTFLQEGIDQAVVERYPIRIDAAKPASCENALATPKSGAVRSNAFYVQF